jgi:Helix-turn-helix domain
MPQPFPLPLALAMQVTRVAVPEALAILRIVADGVDETKLDELTALVPTVGELRLEADGCVSWSCGREVPVEQAGRALGLVLQRLVNAAEQAGERVPAALKFALARISDDRCLVPLQTLAELRRVLDRIAPSDAQEVVANLARRAGESATKLPRPALSTVSDLRRARRARGASLAAIGADTGIPVSLLRELEWGMFDNWWSSSGAEKPLRAYADAAGLDPDAVSALVTTVPGKRAQPIGSTLQATQWVMAGVFTLALTVGLPALMSSLPQHQAPSRSNAAAIAAERTSTVAVIDAPSAPAVTTPAPPTVGTAGTATEASVSKNGAARKTAPAQRRAKARPAKQSFWKRPVLILKFGSEKDKK